MERTCAVRGATLADVGEIQTLLALLTGQKEDAAAFPRHLGNLLADGRYHVLVAEWDGAVAGVAMGILCENLSGVYTPFFVIEDVVVYEERRRGGIGKALMWTLEARARSLGCKYITLASQSKRKEAHRFYIGLGYDHDDAFQKFL